MICYLLELASGPKLLPDGDEQPVAFVCVLWITNKAVASQFPGVDLHVVSLRRAHGIRCATSTRRPHDLSWTSTPCRIHGHPRPCPPPHQWPPPRHLLPPQISIERVPASHTNPCSSPARRLLQTNSAQYPTLPAAEAPSPLAVDSDVVVIRRCGAASGRAVRRGFWTDGRRGFWTSPQTATAAASGRAALVGGASGGRRRRRSNAGRAEERERWQRLSQARLQKDGPSGRSLEARPRPVRRPA